MLPILHNVDSGIKRLLAAPKDIFFDRPTVSRVTWSSASAEHQQLFERYCLEVTHAVSVAEAWWTDMLSQSQARGASSAEALRSLYDRRAAGPASHPAIIRVVRHFWLACDALDNSYLPTVMPAIFLIEWLIERRMTRELVVLSSMPYWPIGIDADGQWV